MIHLRWALAGMAIAPSSVVVCAAGTAPPVLEHVAAELRAVLPSAVVAVAGPPQSGADLVVVVHHSRLDRPDAALVVDLARRGPTALLYDVDRRRVTLLPGKKVGAWARRRRLVDRMETAARRHPRRWSVMGALCGS